ncbi:MAG: LPS export ABC transporter ATP-binding protein [Acidobacteriota bacterium]|nr:LPS export ABC transporter ATP-binding protein [Acidobacteriota bacterium]
MSVLRAEQLVKTYNRRRVVKGLSLEVRSGEIIGLLGRNGAGKTTTFQMMVGLVKPDGGAMFLDGKNISRLTTDVRASMGITYLPQEGSVFLKASVENNLEMVLELEPLSAEERKKIASGLLRELGLLDLAKQSAHSLSGGERRRLEICRALILGPKFLLLDEPFTGIDPLTILELQKIFLHLKMKGLGIVISDHNVRDTFSVVDRAYIIDEGEILIEGTPSEITADGTAREKFLGKDFRLGEEVRA